MNSPAWRLYHESGIRVGTASWTDRTLLEPGLFYPGEVRTAAARLAFYAEQFPIVEVDASYYALPAERNAELWASRTPEHFLFNVKAFAPLTHHPTSPSSLPKDLRDALPDELRLQARLNSRDLPQEVVDETWSRFLAALRPLHKRRKLGAVLFQFPEWFPPSRASRDYLARCKERVEAVLEGAAVAVEFRNGAWMRDEDGRRRTLDFLASYGLTFVCVDMPQGFATSIPPLAEATTHLAVVRFHGRRTDTWGRRGVGVHEKFGYDYSREELAEWKPRVEHLAGHAREIHVLMNNCYRDYAVRSARTMVEISLDLVAR